MFGEDGENCVSFPQIVSFTTITLLVLIIIAILQMQKSSKKK